MDLQKLFNYQNEIEKNITIRTDIPEDQLSCEKQLRFLALHIKLSELANLTKCYKYLSIRPNLPKDKLTLRYVDAFQYLLSIGNKFNYNVITYDALFSLPGRDIIQQFCDLIDQVSLVKKYTKEENFFDGLREYTKLFSMMLDLAKTLKLDFNQVEHYLNSSRLSFSTAV